MIEKNDGMFVDNTVLIFWGANKKRVDEKKTKFSMQIKWH